MWNRVAAALQARLAAQWARGSWPAGPIVMHGSIAALLCGLVTDSLPPFAYALFALSVSALLLAVPLLGDLGSALRSDPAAEWIETLPITRFELRLARTLSIFPSMAALVIAALLPAAIFAPDSFAWYARALLVIAGLAQAVVLSALVLALQSALGGRAEGLLVVAQTILVGAVVLGVLLGLRWTRELRGVTNPADLADWVRLLPTVWFAAWVVPADGARAIHAWAPWGATALALLALAIAPSPPVVPKGHRGRSIAGFLLSPVRRLATRAWVKPAERASFDLVFDGLPLERDFALRTYPMFAIPLVLLAVGAHRADPEMRDATLALMLFTPATYLPILLVQVPATSSPEARWMLETAPVAEADIASGAMKAIAARFLVPLYAILAVAASLRGAPELALCWTPPAFLLSVLLLRKLYPMCVTDLPMSTSPDEIRAELDWTGALMGLAIGSTVLAVLAYLHLRSAFACAIATTLLLAIEWSIDRKRARSEPSAT